MAHIINVANMRNSGRKDIELGSVIVPAGTSEESYREECWMEAQLLSAVPELGLELVKASLDEQSSDCGLVAKANEQLFSNNNVDILNKAIGGVSAGEGAAGYNFAMSFYYGLLVAQIKTFNLDVIGVTK